MDESKNNRASMHAEKRLSWAPRALRPYESDASMLAKLAFLSPGQSAEFLLDAPSTIGTADPNMQDLTTFNFSKEKFIALTGEQPRRLWLQTFDHIPFPKQILRIANIDQPDLSRFRVCGQCLTEGFHSSLHQLNWLDRCFVHGQPLLAMQRVIGNHLWRGLAMRLHETWFKPDGPWTHALDPLRWGPVDRAPYLRVVPELVRTLRQTERWACNASVQTLQWHDANADDATRLRLLVQASLKGQPSPSPRVTKLLRLDEPGYFKVVVSNGALKAARAMSVPDLESVAMKRFEESLSISPAPPWLVQLRRFIKEAANGHDECFALLAQSVMRWQSVWPTRSDPGRSEAVLQQLLGCGLETCAAVRLVEALSVFRSGPMFTFNRRRVPWFRLKSLRAAAGPWLTRSRLTTTNLKFQDNRTLRPLLDLLVSVWVGQTLCEALEVTMPQADMDMIDPESLANAGIGQTSNSREYRRPLLSNCLSQIVFIEESGQAFALYRDPLSDQRVPPASNEHRAQVIEVVCLAEAASQRQWPWGRFIRCNVPSPSLHDRVSAILQRWSIAPDSRA